ncbi:polysaccharide pyruvyl transferase family protein [Vibrio hannami]|uniref:polysaccharide pyruvyl transferase family protein n=1 Tax=Vibrio hannami TaxID=2717094 RepID=UPI0024105B8C|nr:polysaccharide pyruvyl transferase family protein [Vibrio hannami]MDG3088286.1 polysaccharide pyruvyl transferase family protein [Vibrio hannami]
MRIHVHPCTKKNIGDELNVWYWSELLGDKVNKVRSDELLVGIGTVLNDNLPEAKRLHILGSGAGYGRGGAIDTSRWAFHFVRGKLTADKFKLSDKKIISDPGILISRLRPKKKQTSLTISFMPHTGIDSTKYRQLIESMGWNYISPSDEEDLVLQQIVNSDKLITSAMHGAILADSYRIPWLPISTSPEIFPFKWKDWFSSLNIEAELTPVPTLWPQEKSTLKEKVIENIKVVQLKRKLLKLSNSRQFLMSKESVLKERQERMLDKLNEIKETLFVEESINAF